MHVFVNKTGRNRAGFLKFDPLNGVPSAWPDGLNSFGNLLV